MNVVTAGAGPSPYPPLSHERICRVQEQKTAVTSGRLQGRNTKVISAPFKAVAPPGYSRILVSENTISDSPMAAGRSPSDRYSTS